MNDIYFTSDTHFGHANIIKYCNRPFESVEENDECLITQWNARVRPGDRVYHLGDFAFGDARYVKNIIRRLNGQIHFIFGNHDKVIDRNKDVQDMFASCQTYKEVAVTDPDLGKRHKLVLFHYPIEIWNKRHHGAWHLHGHSHGKCPSPEWQPRVDVGVDVWNYTPVSYEEVKKHMSKKVCKPLDHHGRKE
jgi:calcineurin-like phosphoesterase family protein